MAGPRGIAASHESSDSAWFPDCSTDPSSRDGLPPLLRGDPRVHAGDVPMRILERARYQVWVERPLRITGPLRSCCDAGEWAIPGMLRIRRTRSLLRRQPAPVGVPAGAGVQVPAVQAIPADLSLERWWAGW